MAEVYVNNIWTEGKGEKSPWRDGRRPREFDGKIICLLALKYMID